MKSRFLPSKKLLIAFAAVLFIATGFFLFSKFQDRKTLYSWGSQAVATGEIQSELKQTIIQNDTDGDGLKDWEEILWKTDPRKADTDGDGTNDNEEILANRNPLVAGPDDQQTETLVKNTKSVANAESDNSNLTQTDLVARELFTGYLLLKQNNQLGAEQQNELIQNIVQNTLNAPKTDVRYTVADLNLAPDNSLETVIDFVYQHIVITSLGLELEDEAIIIKDALETDDKNKLAELDVNIGVYKEIATQLLTIAVPSDLAIMHLNIINAIENLIENTIQMKTIFEDPILGLVSLQASLVNRETLRENTTAIEIYLAENNFEF